MHSIANKHAPNISALSILDLPVYFMLLSVKFAENSELNLRKLKYLYFVQLEDNIDLFCRVRNNMTAILDEYVTFTFFGSYFPNNLNYFSHL